MKLFLFIIVCITLLGCTTKSPLDSVLKKETNLETVVDSLKTSTLIYKKCTNCNLSGLDDTKLIGFTNRYPPKGNYDKKEIEIGNFKYDTFLILDSESDQRTNGKIYFCYFNQKQKETFINFLPFYKNQIQHFKQLYKIQFVKNTAIISIDYQG